MKQQQFVICLSGRVLDGFDSSTTQQSFAKLFRLENNKAESMLSGKPIRLKQTFDRSNIGLIQKKLTSIGVECRIEIIKEDAGFLKKAKPSTAESKKIDVKYCEQCHGKLDSHAACPNCSAPKEQESPEPQDQQAKLFDFSKFPTSILITMACFAIVAAFTGVIHLMNIKLDGMIYSLLKNELIYIAIVWALLKAFRIGWFAAMVFFGLNIYTSLGYALAVNTQSIEHLIPLLVTLTGFISLLMPSTLRMLEFDRIDNVLNKTGRPVHLAIPMILLSMLSFSVDSSKNEVFVIQASQFITLGIWEVKASVLSYLYDQMDNDWPSERELPVSDSKFIKSATFKDGNMVEVHYLDNPLLKNPSIQLKFSDDGTLLECFTDNIPGNLISPYCINCVCDASSSSMLEQ
ncbi:MAG: hypothetical protein Q9M20_07615 [Mariprofundaceae bacterium]|nr:hypothetical protein [Mariprofundaceae bacterium]